MRSAQRPGRLVQAMAVVLAAAAGPASAESPTPMVVYPLSAVEGTAPNAATEVQSLLEAAAASLDRRGQTLRPASPLVVRPSCGRVPETACLARIAKEGVVLWGTVSAAEGYYMASLRAVDGRGKVYGPVVASVHAFVQSSEPFLRALLAFDTRLGLAAPPPSMAGEPRRALGDVLRGPTLRERKFAAARKPTSGLRSAGKALLIGGIALAGAGAGIGFLDRRLADSLEEKFHAGKLTAADADAYRRVDRYNDVANVLFAAGAVCATTGVTLWILAPDEPRRRGPSFGVTGRF